MLFVVFFFFANSNQKHFARLKTVISEPPLGGSVSFNLKTEILNAGFLSFCVSGWEVCSPLIMSSTPLLCHWFVFVVFCPDY